MEPRERRRVALEVMFEDSQTPAASRIRAIELLEELDNRPPPYDREFYREIEMFDDAALEIELDAFFVPLASERAAVDREIERIERDPALLRRALEREALRSISVRRALARRAQTDSKRRPPAT